MRIELRNKLINTYTKLILELNNIKEFYGEINKRNITKTNNGITLLWEHILLV